MSSRPSFYQWRPHPWHGLEVGRRPPELVQVYIEITPFDVAKYELDKVTGYLRVNRLQNTSATPPALYGLIPRTYCGKSVGALSPSAKAGDGDPLDICVISSGQISHNEVLVDARVIGGLQVVDGEEADDKIVSVLENDDIWGNLRDIADLPNPLVDRLRHYFLTYKMGPDSQNRIQIYDTYGYEHACQVIQAAMDDYQAEYGQAR